MLILSRKKHEQTVIVLTDGRTVIVQFNGFDGEKAKIGFDAPADVRIYRREVFADIQRNGEKHHGNDAS